MAGGNALDYINWRGDITFDADPFNVVDLFLCSQLATPDLSSAMPEDTKIISLKDAADIYFKRHSMSVRNLGVLQSESVLPMLKAMAESRRYEDVKIANYTVNNNIAFTEQFSAVTILLPNDLTVVAYRGTDDTLYGWKENFNIAVSEQVPAQKDALSYLTYAASETTGPLYVVGHSKGGNLAVYAAVKSSPDIQDRIGAVVNYDGPGFRKEFAESVDIKRLDEKIYNVRTQHSMVGTILYPIGEIAYYKSKVKGPMAHDGFNWEVVRNEFTLLEGQAEDSKYFEQTLNSTLELMNTEERIDFINDFFAALMSSGAVTISDITAMDYYSLLKLINNIRKSEKVRAFGTNLIENYIRIINKNNPDPVVTTIKTLILKITN